jgi:hypothetical protein
MRLSSRNNIRFMPHLSYLGRSWCSWGWHSMRQVPRGLEQDSASRMSMTCYVQYDGVKVLWGVARQKFLKIFFEQEAFYPFWDYLQRTVFLLRYIRYGMFYVKWVSRYGTGLVRTVLVHLLKMKWKAVLQFPEKNNVILVPFLVRVR